MTVVTESKLMQLTKAQSQTERLEMGSWEKLCLKPTLLVVSLSLKAAALVLLPCWS